MANTSRGRNTQTTWIIGAVIGVVIAVAAIVAISSTGGEETASDLQQFGKIGRASCRERVSPYV